MADPGGAARAAGLVHGSHQGGRAAGTHARWCEPAQLFADACARAPNRPPTRYNCRLEPCGSLLIPPDFNVGVTDWERSMRLRCVRMCVRMCVRACACGCRGLGAALRPRRGAANACMHPRHPPHAPPHPPSRAPRTCRSPCTHAHTNMQPRTPPTRRDGRWAVLDAEPERAPPPAPEPGAPAEPVAPPATPAHAHLPPVANASSLARYHPSFSKGGCVAWTRTW